MDKIKKIKILSAVSIIGAILAITVAFALMTRSMVINGSGNVKPTLWDIHFKDISEPTITGGASVITEPTVTDKGAKIDNLEVRLTLPQDKVEYTVYIENSGDMNAKIDDIKYPTLTEEESKIFKFSAKYYSNNSPMQVGDVLKSKQIKKVIITIEYLDISDKNLLPKEAKTIDIDFKIKYVQDNNNYTTTTNQTTLLPEDYTKLEYIESTGTQYINTKIKNNQVYGYEIEFQSMGIVKSNGSYFLDGIFGSNGTGKDTKLWFSFPDKDTARNSISIIGKAYSSNNMSYEEYYKKHKIIVLNYEIFYDNFKINEYDSNLKGSGTSNIFVFAVNDYGNPFYYSKTRIFSLKLYDNANNVIINYVPALDEKDKPCMYDTVSGVTFYNQGTGEFNYQLK